MVFENEYLNRECTAQLNDLEKKVNDILGKDTIRIANSKEVEGCIDVWANGKLIYEPADEIEADAFMQGIVFAYEKLATKRDFNKAFVLVNTYFRADIIGATEPIIIGVYDNYAEAKKAMEDEKKEIVTAENYIEEYKIEEDSDLRWTIQNDDWDDWDSLYIEEVKKSGNARNAFLVVETASNDSENEVMPRFLCVTEDKKIAEEAFKKAIEETKFFFGEEFSISEDTDTKFQINSEVYDTWKKISLIETQVVNEIPSKG